ncbi:hypothetical protein PCE1_004818 [Barthelona sp. PCE]
MKESVPIHVSQAGVASMDDIDWNSVISTFILSSDAGDHVFVIKQTDKSIVFQNSAFELDETTIDTCCRIFLDNGAVVFKEGFELFRSQHFDPIRVDDEGIYARKSNSPNEGIVLIRTFHFVIGATYASTMYPAATVECSEAVGDYVRALEEDFVRI